MPSLKVVKAGKQTALAQLVEDYLAHVGARGSARRTLSVYRFNLTRVFLPWAEAESITEPNQLDQRVLDRFSNHLLGKGSLSRASVHSYSRSVNSFLVWARKAGDLKADARAQLPRLERRVLDVLTEQEVARMIQVATNDRDRLIVRILASTGVRLGELMALRVDDLVEQGSRRFLRIRGKGRKERLVALKPDLFRELRRYALHGRRETTDDRLFVGLKKRPDGAYAPLQSRTVEDMVKGLADAAGITKRVHPHLFRHSFITWQLRRGMNQILLQQMVGHADLSMIATIYSHMNANDAYDEMARLWRTED
jgi:integrase/recombinase XerD